MLCGALWCTYAGEGPDSLQRRLYDFGEIIRCAGHASSILHSAGASAVGRIPERYFAACPFCLGTRWHLRRLYLCCRRGYFPPEDEAAAAAAAAASSALSPGDGIPGQGAAAAASAAEGSRATQAEAPIQRLGQWGSELHMLDRWDRVFASPTQGLAAALSDHLHLTRTV